jgi:hypothetical protein
MEVSTLIDSFQESSGKEHNYSPLLIRSFRIKGGEWYFSYAGIIDPSSLQDDNLTYDHLPDTITVAFFIRAVVIGKASMYYARDQNDRIHLFLQKDGGAIRELNYKKYYLDEVVIPDYRNSVTRRAIVANQIYKQQLIDAFADCRPISIRLLERSISYTKNDIMDWVVEYNECMKSRVVYKEEKDRWKFELSLNGGINYGGIIFKSETNTYYGDTEVENSVGFAGGIALNCILPRTRDAWSIDNELLIRNFKSTGLTGVSSSSEQEPIAFDLVYLKLFTLVKYTVPKGSVRPFIDFGFTNAVAMKGENTLVEEQEDFITSFRTYEQGIVFGGGVRWKPWLCNVRMEYSNGISGFSNVKSTMKTLYTTIGYTF